MGGKEGRRDQKIGREKTAFKIPGSSKLAIGALEQGALWEWSGSWVVSSAGRAQNTRALGLRAQRSGFVFLSWQW